MGRRKDIQKFFVNLEKFLNRYGEDFTLNTYLFIRELDNINGFNRQKIVTNIKIPTVLGILNGKRLKHGKSAKLSYHINATMIRITGFLNKAYHLNWVYIEDYNYENIFFRRSNIPNMCYINNGIKEKKKLIVPEKYLEGIDNNLYFFEKDFEYKKN